MSILIHIFSQPWAEKLAWTLMHFLWQGCAIAAVFGAARPLAGGRPRARHALACIALVSMAAAPPITWFWLGRAAAFVPAVGPLSAATTAAALPGGRAGVPLQLVFPWLVMTWLVGVVTLSVRLFGGWLSTRRLRSDGARPAPPEWIAAMERLARRLGAGAGVRLLISARVDVPAVLGWLRPVVLLPLGAVCGLPAEQVEALLAHELAHIRRSDYLINLMQGVAEVMLFYHPAVWWVSRQIRVERELCCDDLAVEASGDVLTYARALAGLESSRLSKESLVMAATGHHLAARIRRLIEPHPRAHAISAPGAAWVLTTLLLVGLGTVAIGNPRNQHAGLASRSAEQYPVIDRNQIWVDTVRQGDMLREVRALGILTSSNSAELNLPRTQGKEVRPGQIVSIRYREIKDVTPGRVVRLGPGTEVIPVEVSVEGALPKDVKSGNEIDGTIRLEVISNVMQVGRPVNGSPNSEGTLFRIEPDGTQAVRVKVEFGRASVNALEIISGLKPGDKVILSDTTAFKDADRINLK